MMSMPPPPPHYSASGPALNAFGRPSHHPSMRWYGPTPVASGSTSPPSPHMQVSQSYPPMIPTHHPPGMHVPPYGPYVAHYGFPVYASSSSSSLRFPTHPNAFEHSAPPHPMQSGGYIPQQSQMFVPILRGMPSLRVPVHPGSPRSPPRPTTGKLWYPTQNAKVNVKANFPKPPPLPPVPEKTEPLPAYTGRADFANDPNSARYTSKQAKRAGPRGALLTQFYNNPQKPWKISVRLFVLPISHD